MKLEEHYSKVIALFPQEALPATFPVVIHIQLCVGIFL